MTDDRIASLFGPFWDTPDRAGVFSDFDGTLAPIVEDPAAAQPHPGVVDVLARLGNRFGRVGVVSGRPLAFLDRHLGGRGLSLAGLYGLERRRGDELLPDEEAEQWRPVVEELAESAPASVPSGALVEAKGLSLVVHFRTSPAAAGPAKEWAEEQAARTGLALHPGRMSVELRPPVPTSKGTAVNAMLDGLEAACFLGDDSGDLPAFDALDDLAARGGHSVRVGVRSDEAPPEVLERADLVVDGTGGVLDLLERLAAGPERPDSAGDPGP